MNTDFFGDDHIAPTNEQTQTQTQTQMIGGQVILPRRSTSKNPPNLTFHARRQAGLRGLALDRLTHQQQDDWKAATGQDSPPRWVLIDRLGKIQGYHYTLYDVIQSLKPIA